MNLSLRFRQPGMRALTVVCASLALACVNAAPSFGAPGSHGASPTASITKSKRCTTRPNAKRSARCLKSKTRKNQDSTRGPAFVKDFARAGSGADATAAQGAIDWALAQGGRSDYYTWCLKFVANAFNSQYSGYNSPVQMISARAERRGKPPIGSLVMFGAARGNAWGHVGIYLGGGKMISAWKTVVITSISRFPNYRGWQPAPAVWPGRVPSNKDPQYVATGYTPPMVTPAPTPAPTTPPPPGPITYPETTAGVSNKTFTNYTNAGGTIGPSIAPYSTIQIACKLQGFAVSNGNNWWYRIAQAPWSYQFYATADAFYNNGATSGSLAGTPYYDPAVPNC